MSLRHMYEHSDSRKSIKFTNHIYFVNEIPNRAYPDGDYDAADASKAADTGNTLE
jgi:hypothetical protein